MIIGFTDTEPLCPEELSILIPVNFIFGTLVSIAWINSSSFVNSTGLPRVTLTNCVFTPAIGTSVVTTEGFWAKLKFVIDMPMSVAYLVKSCRILLSKVWLEAIKLAAFAETALWL